MARRPKPSGQGAPLVLDGREVRRRAERCRACTISAPGRGDHWLVGNAQGVVPVPQRPLGKGLACAIRKELAALGIALVVILLPAAALVAALVLGTT